MKNCWIQTSKATVFPSLSGATLSVPGGILHFCRCNLPHHFVTKELHLSTLKFNLKTLNNLKCKYSTFGSRCIPSCTWLNYVFVSFKMHPSVFFFQPTEFWNKLSVLLQKNISFVKPKISSFFSKCITVIFLVLLKISRNLEMSTKFWNKKIECVPFLHRRGRSD